MQSEAAQDISAEIERLVRERTAELERANTLLKLEIEERERAEEALRESEQQYRTLFDNAGDAIIILNPDGTFLDVNRLMTERLGYSREELLGMTISEIVAPEFAALIPPGIREALETGHLLRESAHMTRDGRRIPVEVSTRIIPYRGKAALLTLARDITKRKQAEEALRESERQLQNAQAMARIGNWVWDLRTNKTVASPELFRIYGIGADDGPEIDNDLFMSTVHPDDRKTVEGSVCHAAESRGTISIDYRIILPDGEIRYIHSEAMLLKDDAGQACQIFGTDQDVTERKRTEEALRESEERFTAFMDNSPAGAWMKDDQGHLVYLNKILEEEYSARSREDWRGKTDFELWPLPVAQQFWENDRTVLKEGRAIDFVEERPNPEGGFTYWWNFKFPFQDASGKRYVGGVGIDITRWKRTEAALQASEEKYRNLVELAPEPIAVHHKGVIIYVNPPCVALLGAKKQEDLIGKPLLSFVHPDDHDVVKGRIRQMKEMGITAPRLVEKFVKLDGQVVDVEVIATPVTYENLPSVMVLFRDITERKRAEEASSRYTGELVQLNRQLEEAEREANLYLDILTHDIGNTENVSNLYADLLIESLDGEAAGHAKNLQRSIRKSIEILGTVSTIRRIHRTTTGLKPVTLDAAIQEVIEGYPNTIFLYNRAHHLVLADDLLGVVFDNLIGNAVKFGGPGVEIAVRIEDGDGDVLVSVEDTGPGVPDDEKEEIFHLYEMKKRGVGKGLGLYLVQILVERYGGTIRVDDRVPGHPEEGAAFRFTLKTVTQHG